jgi:nucleoside phosphorylase
MIAITFALPTESSAIVSRLSKRTNIVHDGMTTIRGYIAANEVEILHTGVGGSMCGRCIEKFLRDQDFKFLISAGFAGALIHAFKIGDLILAANFSDPQLLQAAQRMLDGRSVHTLKLSTVPTMIDCNADRAALAASSGAVVVDMETKSIADACALRRIPLLSVRVISDTPEEPLPAPAKVLFDIQRQRTPFSRLATYAATHPSVIGRLLRFQRKIAKTREILAEALVALVSRL